MGCKIIRVQSKSAAAQSSQRAGGWACGNLGICYQKIGENALAISFTEHDRNIAQEFGDRAQRVRCGKILQCRSSEDGLKCSAGKRFVSVARKQV